jgi:uncharacterized membrane protein
MMIAKISPDAINRNRLRLPGLLLGIGLGGMLDGIVLHQILQWHHMLTSTGHHSSDTVAELEVNTLWDGLFHAFTWITLIAGVSLLYVRLTAYGGALFTPRVLIGWALAGWGLFNVLEGIVFHTVLGLHHVRTGDNQTGSSR